MGKLAKKNMKQKLINMNRPKRKSVSKTYNGKKFNKLEKFDLDLNISFENESVINE